MLRMGSANRMALKKLARDALAKGATRPGRGRTPSRLSSGIVGEGVAVGEGGLPPVRD